MDNKLIFSFRASGSGKHDICNVMPHSHNCHELVFYLGGSNATGQFGDEKYRISPGGVALIASGCIHSETHHNTKDVICIGFQTKRRIQNFYCDNMHHLKKMFELVLEEAKEQQYDFERVVSCEIEKILVNISRKTGGYQNEVKTLEHCRLYIKENYCQDINIADVAAIVNYSSDYFRHIFKRTYGISPQRYLIKERLAVAYKLLTETDLSCARIGERCGFSNSSQFTRMIKEEYGVTPLQIRKQNKLQ